MGTVITSKLRLKKDFGKNRPIIEPPDLIQVQKESYNSFLQAIVPHERRPEVGLQGVFKSVFPIKGNNDEVSLDFQWYKLEEPKYDIDECKQRGMTFQSPVRVKVTLTHYEPDPDTGKLRLLEVKEQEVYFGDMPLMTESGTFVVNGVERVVVNQLHRSPGAFFKAVKGKKTGVGKIIFGAQIIPYRGSWLDLQFDQKDYIWVLVDRNRSKKAKVYASTFLKALGFSTQQLLDEFYEKETVVWVPEAGAYSRVMDYALLKDKWSTMDIKDMSGNKVILRKGARFTDKHIKRLEKDGITRVSMPMEELLTKVFADDIIDEETGEVIAEANQEVSKAILEDLKSRGIFEFRILFFDDRNVGPYFRNTLAADKTESPDDAVMEIYKKLRPGDPGNLVQARKYFESLFFSKARYDLSPVGRLKLNTRFKLDEPAENTVLTRRDILEVVKCLVELRNGRGDTDDIDHLGNRRVRSVGESLENKYRVGLVRMERSIKERMKSQGQDIKNLMPHDLINSKPVIAVVNEFFGSGELSQFMDQTNPLSEMTHKRRLSALGPGGLTRERAGFEVRDVHSTHYGRICPIETPEGPNIGLISSLSTYASVNDYGFIETPYRRVVEGVVTEEVVFLSANEESHHTIAQATAEVDSKGKLKPPVLVRRRGDFIHVRPEEVDYSDVASNQMVSVAAALVPFLEHDDANRALMGANMQRQAVPLLRCDAPIVATGMECVVARNSGVTKVARNSGVVESVDASRIVIRRDSGAGSAVAKPDIYTLTKYTRSNQNTCINQRPLVKKGDRVEAGDIIADGPGTDRGELALGRNVVVAFMPWGGYNFEDAILVSEKLVHEDTFTSVHIFEHECVARETKLGKEEITRDIPNVSEEALKDLDDAGIIRIGAEVKPGDILVGKITPKGETMLSPEEKLLRAIFGEKAGDVRDTSLRVPSGIHGTVVGAKVFARKGVEKDSRSRDLEDADRRKLEKDRDEELSIIMDSAHMKMAELLVGHVTASKVVNEKGKALLAKGVELTEEALEKIDDLLDIDIPVENEHVNEELARIRETVRDQISAASNIFEQRIDRLGRGEDLPPGVIKIVKIYVAVKRRLSVGDKMAGRHGNKGVISRVLPVEDMPFLADGTPVDLVLNPLGVPSRMNVGQVLEVHLGWAAHNLGKQLNKLLEDGLGEKILRKELKKYYDSTSARQMIEELDADDLANVVRDMKNGVRVVTPVFDGVPESDIKRLLETAGVSVRGQEILFDGRSGDAFAHDVTVGVMYMLKLHHLVDDKVHARSTGPYSLVTQQPLGGKAQFGGQRLGEMEVWAIEAYGASYTLQEFLTVKSDDVIGRTRMYEAIVKGENVLEAGIPESFNVLMKEIKSLGIDMDLIERGKEDRYLESGRKFQ